MTGDPGMNLVLRDQPLLMISSVRSLSGPERSARRPTVSITTMTMAHVLGAGTINSAKFFIGSITGCVMLSSRELCVASATTPKNV